MRPTLQQGWTRALKEDPSRRSARDRRGAPRHRAVTALAAHAPSPVAGLSIGLPPFLARQFWLSAVQIGE